MAKKKELEVKTDSKKKEVEPASLEGIPGLGPVGIQALLNDGVKDGLQLVYQGSTYLKDVTGMDRHKASEAIKFLRKRLELVGLIRPAVQTATQVQAFTKEIPKFPTGVKALDRILQGGIDKSIITEFYGHEGSGKSQTGLSLCIQALKSEQDGGLDKEEEFPYCAKCQKFYSKFEIIPKCTELVPENPDEMDADKIKLVKCGTELGKKKRGIKVLIIDTERTTRPERLVSILAGKGMIVDIPNNIQKKQLDGKSLTADEEQQLKEVLKLQDKEAVKYLDKIIVEYAINGVNQTDITAELIDVVPRENVKLIVVDSGTALYRGEFIGRGNMKSKFDYMNEMMQNLKRVSQLYNVPVIFINQIYNKPDEMYGNDPDIPYGGHIVGHTSQTRIKLWKSGRKHKARIIKSSYLDNLDCEFQIANSGIADVD